MFKALMIIGALALPLVQGSVVDFKAEDCTTPDMHGKINSIAVTQKPKEMDDTTILKLNVSVFTPIPNEFANSIYDVIKIDGGESGNSLFPLCGAWGIKCPITGTGEYTVEIGGVDIISGTYEDTNYWINQKTGYTWICYKISYKHSSRRRNLRGVIFDD